MASELLESFIKDVQSKELRVAYKYLNISIPDFDYRPMEFVIIDDNRLTQEKVDMLEIHFITIFKRVLQAVGLYTEDSISLENCTYLIIFITDINNEETLPLLEGCLMDDDTVMSICRMTELVTGEPIDPITLASEALNDVDDELYLKIKRLIENEGEDIAANAQILKRIEDFLKDNPGAVGGKLANDGVTGGVSTNYLTLFKDEIVVEDNDPDEVIKHIISLMIIAGVPASMIKDKIREILDDYVANTVYAGRELELTDALNRVGVG